MRQTGFKRKEFTRVPPSLPQPIRRTAPALITARSAIPKNPRYVDRHLLSMARGQACLLQSPICNHDPETTVACHAGGVANGKGMGYKTGDHLTVWGCSQCNHFTDGYGGATSSQKAEVFEAGHQRQISAWRELLEDPRTLGCAQVSLRSALVRCDMRTASHGQAQDANG